MRRFAAYLTLAISGLIMVGVTFSSTLVQANSNIEYSDGRALVYRLSKENGDELTQEDEGASKEMASVMESRLKTAKVSNYDIVTEGDDTLKIVLAQNTEEGYNQVRAYLAFDGTFALGTDTNVMAIGDEFMTSSKAYVSFIKDYPTVVIPINKDSEAFKAVITEAKKINETANGEGDGALNVRKADDTKKTYVYLAYNFVKDEDLISQMIEGNADYDAKKAEKLLIKFDISQIWFDDTETSIATAVEIDSDGDGSYSYTDIKNGTQKANFYCNLLNAEHLDYKVTFLYEYGVPAYFENIIDYNMQATVAWSRTFIAALVGIAIIALLLAVFYRWGAVTIGTFAIGSCYIGLLISLVFSAEFNIAGVIAYLAVAIASIASGVIYMTKLKEECYRGRSLKKANSEASKKSLLPIVDIHVALIVIGACAYWLGGASMVTFAAVVVFGGLASLLLNTLGLKGMMWLLTNTTKFTGNYEVIGVDSNKVPNLLNEEKQSYYGPYDGKDFTKKKKPVGIIAAILFVGSLAGMIAFGAINGSLFNHGSDNTEMNYIYFETKTAIGGMDSAYVQGLLDNTHVYVNGADSEATLLKYDLQQTYTRTDTEDDVTVTYTYLVCSIDSSYETSLEGYIDYKGFHEEGTLDTLFTSFIENHAEDSQATASFKVGERANITVPESSWVIIATAVASGFMWIYFILRYRLSRGLTSLIITGMTGGIALGFFVLTRIIASEALIYALPLIVFVTMVMEVIFMNKDREMAKDDFVRTKDNSYAHRNEIMVKATALSFAPILAVTVLAGYLAIDFFGFGPTATSLIFGVALIGIIIGALLVTTLYGPISQFFFKIFSRVNININRPKKKKKVETKSKTAEPEEAVFIGIND